MYYVVYYILNLSLNYHYHILIILTLPTISNLIRKEGYADLVGRLIENINWPFIKHEKKMFFDTL